MLGSEIDTTALKLKYNKIPKIDDFFQKLFNLPSTLQWMVLSCIGSQLARASMDCSMGCSRLYGLF